MIFKSYAWNIFFRTLLTFLMLALAAYALVNSWYMAELLFVPLIVWLFIGNYRYHKKAQDEVLQFVESVHYRDFSRHFDVKQAPAGLQPFRVGFNQINSTFKIISKEKETQYLHLKTILEMVDTGILSYNIENGEVLWMNESLKNLLHIPYLKTIHSLNKRNSELYQSVWQLKSGKNEVITIKNDSYTIINNSDTIKLILSATTFTEEGKTYKLIAFQNINEALDEGEALAWQKLLSVMTHEIMNSVAPISSLASTLKARLQESIAQPQTFDEVVTDIDTGISTIQKRSEGLLRFTETYRQLSKITRVSVSKIVIIELLEHVQQLMQPTFDQKQIVLETILRDPFLTIEADAALIEQVLINLLLNAIDAVKEIQHPRITISAETLSNGRVTLHVTDNGAGIAPELLDKIFIPFFSTKKAGSGIGLSLCKQVMLLHKGTIKVQNKLGGGAVFSLVF